MNIQSLDIGLIVVELIEVLLSRSEVIGLRPVGEPALKSIGVEPVFEAGVCQRSCELAVVVQAILQVSYHLWTKKIIKKYSYNVPKS